MTFVAFNVWRRWWNESA